MNFIKNIVGAGPPPAAGAHASPPATAKATRPEVASALQREIDHIRAQNVHLATENSRLRESEADLLTSLSELQSRLEDRNSANGSTLTQSSSSSIEEKRLREELRSLEQQVEASNKQMASVAAARAQTVGQLALARDKLEELRDENSRLKLVTSTGDLGHIIRFLEDDLTKTKDKVRDVSTENTGLTTEISRLTEQLGRYKRQSNEASEEVTRLKQENSVLRENLAQIQNALSESSRELEYERQERIRVESENNRLHTANALLTESRSETVADLRAMEREVEVLRKEKAETLLSLQEQFGGERNKADVRLEAFESMMTAQLSLKENERDRALTDATKTLTEAQTLLHTRNAKLLEDSQVALTEKDRALTEKDRALTEKDRALSDKDRALTDATKTLSDVTRELTEAQLLSTSLQTQCTEYTERIQSLTEAVDALTKQNGDVKLSADKTLSDAILLLQSQLVDKTSEINCLNLIIAQKAEQMARVVQQHEAAQTDAMRNSGDVEATIVQVMARYDALTAETEALKSLLSTMERELEGASTTCYKMKSESDLTIAALERNIASYREEIANLTDQLQQSAELYSSLMKAWEEKEKLYLEEKIMSAEREDDLLRNLEVVSKKDDASETERRRLMMLVSEGKERIMLMEQQCNSLENELSTERSAHSITGSKLKTALEETSSVCAMVMTLKLERAEALQSVEQREDRVNKTMAEMITENTSLKLEMTKLQRENSELCVELGDFRGLLQLASKPGEVSFMDGESEKVLRLQRMVIERKDTKIKELESKLGIKSDGVRAPSSTTSTMSATTATLMHGLEDEVERWKSAFTSAEQDLSLCQAQLRDCQKEISRLTVASEAEKMARCGEQESIARERDNLVRERERDDVRERRVAVEREELRNAREEAEAAKLKFKEAQLTMSEELSRLRSAYGEECSAKVQLEDKLVILERDFKATAGKLVPLESTVASLRAELERRSRVEDEGPAVSEILAATAKFPQDTVDDERSPRTPSVEKMLLLQKDLIRRKNIRIRELETEMRRLQSDLETGAVRVIAAASADLATSAGNTDRSPRGRAISSIANKGVVVDRDEFNYYKEACDRLQTELNQTRDERDSLLSKAKATVNNLVDQLAQSRSQREIVLEQRLAKAKEDLNTAEQQSLIDKEVKLFLAAKADGLERKLAAVCMVGKSESSSSITQSEDFEADSSHQPRMSAAVVEQLQLRCQVAESEREDAYRRLKALDATLRDTIKEKDKMMQEIRNFGVKRVAEGYLLQVERDNQVLRAQREDLVAHAASSDQVKRQLAQELNDAHTEIRRLKM